MRRRLSVGPVWASIHGGCHTWKMLEDKVSMLKQWLSSKRSTYFMIKTNMEITPENEDMDLLDIFWT